MNLSKVLQPSYCIQKYSKKRTRVARWYILKPKIQIWEIFGGFCNGRCWYSFCPIGTYILQPLGIFYGHLVYVLVIWYIFLVLVFYSQKNLATLKRTPVFKSGFCCLATVNTDGGSIRRKRNWPTNWSSN
jgi:hypothetical protein